MRHYLDLKTTAILTHTAREALPSDGAVNVLYLGSYHARAEHKLSGGGTADPCTVRHLVGTKLVSPSQHFGIVELLTFPHRHRPSSSGWLLSALSFVIAWLPVPKT